MSNDKIFQPIPEPPMTKREAFAMAAMQGLLANPNVIWAVRGELHSAKDIQSIANRLADEQLAALDPPK